MMLIFSFRTSHHPLLDCRNVADAFHVILQMRHIVQQSCMSVRHHGQECEVAQISPSHLFNEKVCCLNLNET